MYILVFQGRVADQVTSLGRALLQCHSGQTQAQHHPNMLVVITTNSGMVVYLYLIIQVLHLGRINHLRLFRLCSLRSPFTICPPTTFTYSAFWDVRVLPLPPRALCHNMPTTNHPRKLEQSAGVASLDHIRMFDNK
jgi:hypothetical protein